MRMQRKQFRIGDLADKLSVEKFVIRFWEKEFEITPHRSEGGQRFYEDKDFKTFATIKTLLYEQGYTIAGAKKQLSVEEQTSCRPATRTSNMDPSLHTRLTSLRKQLIKFKEQL